MALTKGDKIITEDGLLEITDDDTSGVYWYLTRLGMRNTDPVATIHKTELHGEWITPEKNGQTCHWMLKA
jgi:hypothetical protein